MHNLDNIVKLYYCAVSAQAVIKDKISYSKVRKEEFMWMSKAYFLHYSDTENSQLYDYIEHSVNEEGHPFASMEKRSGLNVFVALEELAEQLLIMEEGKVKCIYKNLLRFREVTKFVEEDLLICAFLVMRYKRFYEEHHKFSWNTTIEHNNVQLARIMKRGISENHFHLYGSAPSYHLLWIHFMNYVGDIDLLKKFAKEVEKRQRSTREHYSITYSEEPFIRRILQAGLIRVCLVYALLGWELDEHVFVKIKDIEKILMGDWEIESYYVQIQQMINSIKDYALLCGKGQLFDYALISVEGYGIREEHYEFSGERWLMYSMLRDEICDRKLYEKLYQWFYAYLIIKNNIRGEIVQINETVGFENFSLYNKRKSGYRDLKKMVKYAVAGSLENGNMKALELRITPAKKVLDNVKTILEIEQVLQEIPYSGTWYYVYHFTKSKDKGPSSEEVFCCNYRHYRKRKELEQIAGVICRLREQYREIASKVLGIDACSQEIGCRPEVFACVFRQLSEHIVEELLGAKQIAQLKKTYHVGEDFLDVVDGLRAVDEAVKFLNLQCGDRIGHGTVLGIDVRKWYLFKKNTIVLSKQDYLDNIVWLYHKLVEYKIKEFFILQEKLLNEFNYYFAEIYLKDRKITDMQFDIHVYYEAWKLRGDDPNLYFDGKFHKSAIYNQEWLVNRKYPEKFIIRERKEVCYLYYLYHFDTKVRKKGSESIQVYISSSYIYGVEAVQKAFGKDFASKGIGVETNPSSNLAISPIQSYDEHPIVQLYNKDATWDAEKLDNCPQMNVSINTDDKGVFHTSLENEYALMACALEKVKDEKEQPIYNKQMVYQWIDNIRVMGNLQSFSNVNEYETVISKGKV